MASPIPLIVPQIAKAKSLWERAFNALDQNLRVGLNSTRTHQRNVLNAVLKEADAKKELCTRKRWKFKKANGETIIVRDLLEKISCWVNRFIDIGDIMIQVDPVHAALPWAAVRFLLRVTVSEVQLFGSMVNDLEAITRLITFYGEFEVQYLQGTASHAQATMHIVLEDALTRLYAEVLTHLARAVSYFGEKDAVRLLKAPFRTVDTDHMKDILAREDEVMKIAKVADRETLQALSMTILRQVPSQSAKSSQLVTEERFQRILAWLSALPYYDHHQFVSESRLPGTGKWLLNHPTYIEWLNSSTSAVLLLTGITGSGKTTLCSMVVDILMKTALANPSAAPWAYFYCANPELAQTRVSSDGVLRTVIGQLAIDKSSSRSIKDFLWAEYERQSSMPRVDRLGVSKLRTRDCVRLILELAEQDPLAIFIAGIDSIDVEERNILIDALEKIVLKSDNVVKIFITSRHGNLVFTVPAATRRIHITTDKCYEDIVSFVKGRVQVAESSKMLLGGNVSPELRGLLEDALIDGAGEMFLWVKLQIDRLCRNEAEEDIMASLRDGLPDGLSAVYQETLAHVFDAGPGAKYIAMGVFSWLLHMQEPLTKSALMLALTAYGRAGSLTWEQLTSICGNMVILNDKSNTVQFSHQSLRDFLAKHKAFSANAAQRLLASTCIEACARGPTLVDWLRLPSDDFYTYAAMYWPLHLRLSQDLEPVKHLLDTASLFMFDEDLDTTLSFDAWLSSVKMLRPIIPDDHSLKPDWNAFPEPDSGGLFLLSVFGLDGLLRTVLKALPDIDVNQRNRFGITPLYLAAAKGHLAVVSTLVEYGAEANVECGRFGSPLHAACFSGHVEVAEALFRVGVNPLCGAVFRDALDAAFRGGSELVALRLVRGGFMVNTTDECDEAYQGAARAGFTKVIDILQQQLPISSTILGQPDKAMKKVRKAIEGGQIGVLRQFLAKPTATVDHLPLDCVALATVYNHRDLVEFFLDQGMSHEVEGAFGTPLRTACLLHCKAIVRLLLDRGADVNACGPLGDALQAASLRGHASVVKLLIDEGANLDQNSGFYGTALQAAAYSGHQETVEILLDAGADIFAKGFSHDAFHAASEGGHESVIMTMLRRGYKFRQTPHNFPRAYGHGSPPPSPYRNLLRDASPERGHDLARESSQQQDIENNDRSPRIGNVTVKKPLTNIGTIYRVVTGQDKPEDEESDPTKTESLRMNRDWWKRNRPLGVSAAAGHELAVSFLLEQRGSLGIMDEEIKFALECASANGHLPIVRLLFSTAISLHIWPSIDLVNSVLDLGRSCQRPDVVGLALSLASEHCMAEDIAHLSQTPDAAHPPPTPTKTKCSDQSSVLNDNKDAQNLLQDFLCACKSGDKDLVRIILAPEREDLSVEDIDRGLQTCAAYTNIAIAQMVVELLTLSMSTQIPYDASFVTAAANGNMDFLEFLVPILTSRSSDTVFAKQRALVASSENGHVHVVKYLVEMLFTDVNVHAPGISEIHRVSGSSSKLSNSGSDIGLDYWDDGIDDDDWPPRNQNNDSHTRVPCISPLQAVLRGFSRFESSVSDTLEEKTSGWCRSFKVGSRVHQDAVLSFLLRSGADPNDLGGQATSPLHVAAGRESAAASAVDMLLDAGATVPNIREEWEELLQKPLQYFQGETQRAKIPGGLHSHGWGPVETLALTEVFRNGPAAVLYSLLYLAPQVTAENTGFHAVFQMAAFLNHHAMVALLLSRGVDINATSQYYGTALQAAARCGHEEMVNKLLEAGANVNILEGQWHTSLRAAIVGCHTGVVHTLLGNGADVKIRFTEHRDDVGFLHHPGETTLELAVYVGNLDIVEAVLNCCRDAASFEAEIYSAILISIQRDNIALLRNLLDAGTPIHPELLRKSTPDRSGMKIDEASPLHAAVAKQDMDMILKLLSRNMLINNHVEGIGSPLKVASFTGNVDIVRLLLSHGATPKGDASLFVAVELGHVDVIRLLLAAGVEVTNELDIACSKGRLEEVELLLEHVCASDNSTRLISQAFKAPGLTDSVLQLMLEYAPPTLDAVFAACSGGHLKALHIILDQMGLEVDHQHVRSGHNALQIAVSHMQTGAAQMLVSRGATVDICTSTGVSPLQLVLQTAASHFLRRLKTPRAEELMAHLLLQDLPMASASLRLRECESIVRLLVENGADLNKYSTSMETPLNLACLLGSAPMVKFLLAKGASVSITTGYFEHPIFAALWGKDANVLGLLLENTPLTNHVHQDFASPLHLACAVGNDAKIHALLEHGADVNARNSADQTPMSVLLQSQATSETLSLDTIKALSKNSYVLDHELVAAAEWDLVSFSVVTTWNWMRQPDIERAAELRGSDDRIERSRVLTFLLDQKPDMKVSVEVMRRILPICVQQTQWIRHRMTRRARMRDNARRGVVGVTPPRADQQYSASNLEALMRRSRGVIGVTPEMLKVISRNSRALSTLLEFKPICEITTEILQAQQSVECMNVLLKHAPSAVVTEGVILRALEIDSEDLWPPWEWDYHSNNFILGFSEEDDKLSRGSDASSRSSHDFVGDAPASGRVLKGLVGILTHNPQLVVTDKMLKAAQSIRALEVLLQHLMPGSIISREVVTAVTKRRVVYPAIFLLGRFDMSIRLSAKLALRTIGHYPFSVDILEILLQHDGMMPVTERMFLHVFETTRLPFGPSRNCTTASEWERQSKLAHLMQVHGKRLVFTARVRELIDQTYQSHSEAAQKAKFYSLQDIVDEDLGEAADTSDDDQGDSLHSVNLERTSKGSDSSEDEGESEDSG